MSDAIISDEQRARCAAQHFGPWAIEPYWFIQAVEAVKAGVMVPVAATDDKGKAEPYEKNGDIAVIPIYGQMTKGQSSFGGTSTVQTRRAIRAAVNDNKMRSILLHIDSPGGTVAGTAELATEIARANEQKPVNAYIEDMGASAAYWVASQAGTITANATAMIGSIGTLAVLQDVSGMAEMKGIKVHAVSTGAYKGAFTDGTPITPEQLEYAQAMVDSLNEHMLGAIKAGRQMNITKVRKVADGRLYSAADAREAGLIDRVEPLEAAVGRIRRTTQPKRPAAREARQRRIHIAEAKGDVMKTQAGI